MNDKTNFAGYSQAIGLTSNASTTLTTNCNGTVNTHNYGMWAIPLSGGSSYNSLSQAITNNNNMVKQTKVAVFTVERNDKNQVTSAKLVKELWVEVKNGTSLDLAVAKQLDKDYDPANTVVREIFSFTF